MAIATGTGLAIAGGLGAAGMIGGGLLGGDGESRAAKSAASAQSRLAQAQAQMAESQWTIYKKWYLPVEKQMMREYSGPVENQPGYLKSVGDLEKGYADAGANLRRTMAGRYPSGGGLEVLPQATLAMNKPRDKAELRGQFDQRRMAAIGMGRGLPASAQAGLASAGNTYSNLMGYYGNRDAQGADLWNNIGGGMGNLAQMYMLMNSPYMKPITPYGNGAV